MGCVVCPAPQLFFFVYPHANVVVEEFLKKETESNLKTHRDLITLYSLVGSAFQFATLTSCSFGYTQKFLFLLLFIFLESISSILLHGFLLAVSSAFCSNPHKVASFSSLRLQLRMISDHTIQKHPSLTLHSHSTYHSLKMILVMYLFTCSLFASFYQYVFFTTESSGLTTLLDTQVDFQ